MLHMSVSSITKSFSKAKQDFSDVGRLLTQQREPPPAEREEAKTKSRKDTGLRRDQRARHLGDDQLKTKYQQSCRKLVENGAAVIGAIIAALGSAKYAPLAMRKLDKVVEYSVKGARQVLRSRIYRQELIDRGYQPILGFLKLPDSMAEFKREYRLYRDAVIEGGSKGLFAELSKEARQSGKGEMIPTVLYTLDDQSIPFWSEGVVANTFPDGYVQEPPKMVILGEFISGFLERRSLMWVTLAMCC